ncbi:N-acetylmuramoyl-L-alanine amidase [Paenibacillus aquistagni]|uniref:N-acetylmuramoyl-L-alanine amidase n=1 Tax=Paenibacillus aquistagni TaxID=1852522 RepID=UPI00145AA913|nr:N-acetylmuramoyl-L-alanine amidase [Paenibacillus aquistagni]NMM52166.1 N-acetylmuramoyl-L-alanine amidase [Paenibacillus aquistagni]
MSKIVIIDAGHGGKDSGAAANGIKEKDIALRIAKEVARRLNQNYEGVKCILTRSTDSFLELKQRTDISNRAKADVLISIHCNAGGGAGGFESFSYNKTTDKYTLSLQAAVHTEIMTALKPFGVINRGLKRADLHMCRESHMPAVLTENLFIDVAGDAAKLKRADVIEALIQGHVLGIVKYLVLKPKKSVSVYVDGKQVQDAIIVDGVTYAPVRAISEALGQSVSWDAVNKRVDINSK